MPHSQEQEKGLIKPGVSGDFVLPEKGEAKEKAGDEPVHPEIIQEDLLEKEKKLKGLVGSVGRLVKRQPPPVVVFTDDDEKVIKEIEGVLAEDLEEIFIKMSPEEQQVFKAKGEETAKKIYLLMKKAKIKVKEILNLIKIWLGLVPGVNKFFLEQEAKIKAEKIFRMKK